MPSAPLRVTTRASIGAIDAAAIRAATLARFPHADGSYLFWTAPDDHACFTPDGDLTRSLTVYVDGPGIERAFHGALHLVALTAEPGTQSNTMNVHDPLSASAARTART